MTIRAWLLAAVLLLACRDAEPRLEGTHTAVEYEAPRLIPGMRAQLDRLAEVGEPDERDFTAYRGSAANLIAAMQSDLIRVGLSDTGAFKVLSDSIARDLAGGAGGSAKEPKRPDLGRHMARMRSLIGVYERWMRLAPN